MKSLLLAAAAALSIAATPTLAGTMDDMPPMGGPMSMWMVSVTETNDVMAMPMQTPIVAQLQNHDETYVDAASVLNGAYFNAQHGWGAGGFINLPDGASIWIELVDQTDGLLTYRHGSFDPIFGTDGSSDRVQWDGMMMHNYYVASDVGTYSASYRLYVGDAFGTEVPGYSDAEVTWNFELVPTPGALAVLGIAGIIHRRPRRR